MADFKIASIRYTWKGAWTATTSYIKDDIVNYGGKVYVCFSTHTSATTFLVDLNNSIWVLMLDGYTWRSAWTITTLYNPGDLVRYDGIVYRCLTSHTSNALTTSGVAGQDSSTGLEADQTKWEIVAKTSSWNNNWATSTRYNIGDSVRYGGRIYECILEHNSAATTALGLEADQSKWITRFIGKDYKTSWTTATRYKIEDIVKWGGTLWKCSVGHTSTTFAADLSNWSVYLDGLQYENAPWTVGALYQQGDVVDYGGYAYRALQNNQGQVPSVVSSPFWQLVTENYRFRGDWQNLDSQLAAVYYLVGDVVRLNGYTYVCISDNQNQEPPNATYWTQINLGHQWRSAWAVGTLLAPVKYKKGDLATFGPNTYECILAHTASLANRPDTDIAGSGTYWQNYQVGTTTNVLQTQGDSLWYNSGAKARLPIGTEGQVLTTASANPIWGTWGDVIPRVYYVATNGVDDITNGYGQTIDKPFRSVRYACANVVGPATIFIKTGIYSEILPITIPAYVCLVGDELRSTNIQPASGYEGSNMFYVRDATGIRNMTLQGLTGTLGDFNIYLTKRPTGGAFVSLDPAGASDPLAQITTRSPYVQNVTTIGSGCVGLKIDGAIHAGGLKSVVANDFTQVITDGIGVWLTNKARAELVSVFTYYCHIGYLTENGGRIRATNGNNSYGDFGAVSEGTAPDEQAIAGAVNNVAQQATIGFVFCDGQNILTVEYDNAGKNYDSTAAYTFVGTGLGAQVANANVVSGGVMEVRLTDPGTGLSAGGSGFLQVTNNAQSGSGSSGTIYLAQSDSNSSANYVGLRIVITSGKGAGQYGYIQAYSSVSKLAQVYTETSNIAGWDHVVPGTTIVNLDTTSQYSIEPRVTFTAPGSGTRAQARAVVVSGRISKFRVWDPGSGYSSVSPPTMTVTDPNRGDPVSAQVRVGDGVLAQPTWANRGTSYLTATATVSGTGYQDAFQIGSYLYVNNLGSIPGPGANITIAGDSTNYRLVAVDTIAGSGPYTARLQLNPAITLAKTPAQGAAVSARINYSQNRLTGHDFLEVGTGNFSTTNYPREDTSTIKPEQLAVENGGGRVFYTATDQDGNFRVGALFKVEQASGIATLNASFFQLNGLTQLTLGGIVLGGVSATVTEISTDATMPANSDNIIVTQRAIKAYIASRIGGGGANLNVNQITAGQIVISNTTVNNVVYQNISNSIANAVNFKSKVMFTGGVDGSMLANAFFVAGMQTKTIT